MRFLIFTILITFSLFSEAFPSNRVKVDSIYNVSSAAQKINQLVWLRINNGADLNEVDQNTINKYGAVYFSKPFEAYESYIFNRESIPSLAIQLDERLNPTPEDAPNLPSLNTLSTIRSEELLKEYFDFLKAFGKSQGISYMVLPKTSESHQSHHGILQKIAEYDSKYFVRNDRIAFNSLKKKKEFLKLFETPRYWATDIQNINTTDHAIGRHGKRVDLAPLEDNIKFSILNKYTTYESTTKTRLPNRLAVRISRASIVPLQKNTGVLPIKSDTVCLLTNEPMGRMAWMLSKYTYLITSERDILQSKSPIIIDNIAQSDIPKLDDDRKIIFLGTYSRGLTHGTQFDAALFTSLQNEMYSYLLPQLIFGVEEAKGRFPIEKSIYDHYTNEPITGLDILGYTPPDITGLDDEARFKIKEIITEAIKTGSTPGCQLAITLDGSIVLEEGFGYLTYDSLIAVEKNTIYDLASVTKVTATLLAVMKLYEDGLINLDSAVSAYLSEYQSSNKSQITVRQLLSHNAGLVSYSPFWKRTLGGDDQMETFYYETKEDEINDRRSYGTKPNVVLQDSLKNWILHSPLINYDSIPGYRYSDIGFMILHQLVEALADTTMESFLQENFYSDLGLEKLQFNPINHGVARFEIAPTEYDYYFRNEQVWGQVHDRNAVVFGGVAGHAGLFSNAHDLLILLQMIAQNGEYGGIQYLKPSTIAYFNDQYFRGNRRGLGWDKRGEKVSNASEHVSYSSFGHTGFTGTMVWVDPEYDLVFVFLSNRVYPNANNYKLNKMDIRSRVQDVIYDAILSKWMN
ncbi:MAG: serine hydrolase [Cyclobacteriaceae bacterium]